MGNRGTSLGSRKVFRQVLGRVLALMALLAGGNAVAAGFVPPQNVNAGQSSTPTLDSSFEREAWLVYSYDVNTEGNVVNAKIHSSNGVTEVENKILGHVNSMRFHPATRDGNPVLVSVGPIVYTWILDRPRAMTESFDHAYQEAWAHFKQEDYDKAFDYAAQLKNLPGRNAFEEIKFQILAASLANRWEDSSQELAHLQRIVEFQSLADRNRFTNSYVEEAQYLLILERIHTLQLELMMLADGEVTLNKMMVRDGEAEPTNRAKIAHQQAEGRFKANPDVSISGELTPKYRGGEGLWETRLTRDRFSLSNVKGSIESVYLACQSGGDMRLRFPARDPWVKPSGWSGCKIEVEGRSGTRFILHQLAPTGSTAQR